MPEFKLPTTRSGRGPKPTCICGECPRCKSRLRQRRFYERMREQGVNTEEDTLTDIEMENDERVCFEHDIVYSLKIGCRLCKENRDGV